MLSNGNLCALFLSLVRKKKMPKRKDPVCAHRATPAGFQPKGQKLASLRQSALLNGFKPPSASRPPVNAGEPCGIKLYYVETWRAASLSNAAWPRLSGGA